MSECQPRYHGNGRNRCAHIHCTMSMRHILFSSQSGHLSLVRVHGGTNIVAGGHIKQATIQYRLYKQRNLSWGELTVTVMQVTMHQIAGNSHFLLPGGECLIARNMIIFTQIARIPAIAGKLASLQ